MRHQLEKEYPSAGTRRDAHPKHTGLLEGVFTVTATLPPELRVGVFAEPRSYQAWVRASNATRSNAISPARARVRPASSSK